MSDSLLHKKSTVLVIDKDEKSLQSLSNILSTRFNVITANNGQEGMNILRMNIARISVIVLDSQLSEGNQYEYLEQIKNDKLLRYIPVVIATDTNQLRMDVKWIELGTIDFIIKPYHPLLVLDRIRNIIRLTETTSILKALEKDELTGLFTRQAFIHHASLLIEQNPNDSYCIVGFDVENFKLSNTQYGEDRCNEFLAYITGRLITYLNTGFAGRFGGDQFVVLYKMAPHITTEFIQTIVSEILEGAPIPHQIVKVGIYQPIDTTLPFVRCCDRAFLALREIKGVYGKDIIYYEDRIQQQLLDEQRIVESMEKALKEEQFRVFYQPKHESVTGKIAGAEALIRWEHPDYGFMSPGQFIPIFEKNGFITKIDKFVMNKVCDDILNWQNSGIPVVPVSVNISRRDFFEPDWIDNQLKSIDERGLDHSLIHMEVTESMYSENVDYIIEQVKKVQDLGYMIEMDDFGAGYSSLGLLSTFPLNVIKLDISFVRHITENEVVIENIIKMAHSMGFITVAEGAETKEEFKILKELGCDLIQGYVFSKPLPSTEFEEYLRHNACSLEPISTAFTLSADGQYNDVLLTAANEFAEGIPGGFFSYHADGNLEIITINKEILKIYECETAEEFRNFTGNSFAGMVYEEDFPRVQESINNQISKNNNLDYVEYRIKCKNGKIKYIIDYGRLVHTEKFGDIFYVFINDATEDYNKSIEEQKKAEIIQGVSQMYSSIFLLDFETKKMTPYSLRDTVSAGRAKVIGFGVTEDYDILSNTYINNYVSEDDAELMRKSVSIENIKDELSKSQYFSFTFHQKQVPDGRTLTEMAFCKLLDENSNSRVVITFRPVSEKMVTSESEKNKTLVSKIEEKTQKEENYKTANNSNKIFLDKTVKEILVPLTDLIDSVKNAKNNLSNKDALNEYLNKCQDAQERLSFIVNDIIKLRSTEDSLEYIDEHPTDISGAIEKSLLMIKPQAENLGVEVETWIDVKNPYIYQDVSHTAEVVCHILFNAIKYTPKGGKISFGLKQYPGDSKDTCIIEFVCKDSGIGISEDFISKVFDQFAREDNEINKKLESAGNGMYISKKLVEAMNGKIEITSAVGKGTEVKVITPHRFADKKGITDRETLISEFIKS